MSMSTNRDVSFCCCCRRCFFFVFFYNHLTVILLFITVCFVFFFCNFNFKHETFNAIRLSMFVSACHWIVSSQVYIHSGYIRKSACIFVYGDSGTSDNTRMCSIDIEWRTIVEIFNDRQWMTRSFSSIRWEQTKVMYMSSIDNHRIRIVSEDFFSSIDVVYWTCSFMFIEVLLVDCEQSSATGIRGGGSYFDL
jgi:hypothetical protein